MQDEQFTKLFKYIEDFRLEVNAKLENTANRESMDKLVNTIDAFVKRLDDNETEQTFKDRQFDRLLEWARKVSAKTGIPLERL
jgi:ribosome assembly protein YihI (activator of Der GTPase)